MKVVRSLVSGVLGSVILFSSGYAIAQRGSLAAEVADTSDEAAKAPNLDPEEKKNYGVSLALGQDLLSDVNKLGFSSEEYLFSSSKEKGFQYLALRFNWLGDRFHVASGVDLGLEKNVGAGAVSPSTWLDTTEVKSQKMKYLAVHVFEIKMPMLLAGLTVSPKGGVSLSYVSNTAELYDESFSSVNTVTHHQGALNLNVGAEISKRFSSVEVFGAADLAFRNSLASDLKQEGDWSYNGYSEDSLKDGLKALSGMGGGIQIGARLIY